MTNEELVALIQAGDHVQDNMGLLYQQNRRFITGIALPFSNSVELDDLMQEAYFGLEKAVSKYDPTLGYAFLTYAENHIRLSIQRYCQNCGRLKRVPVHVLEQISKYQKFRSDFQAVVGDEPTDEEYCFYLGIENRRLKELRKYMTGSETASLDGIVPGTEDFTLADVIADDFNLEESVCDTLADEQAKTTIWGAVSDLGGNASEVVQGYYKNGETLQGISDRLEVSIERVRQIKNRAISNLRRNRKLKEAAEVYGYGCAQAYYWGLGHFKNTGTSATEYLALKHIEQEQSRKNSAKEIRGISTFAQVSSARMKKENGTVPIGLKKLQKTIKQAEALLREADELTKRR